MAISKMGIILPFVNFLGVEIMSSFGFCGISFDPDMLERQSRTLKTREIS